MLTGMIHGLLKFTALLATLTLLWGFVVWVDPWLSQTNTLLTQGLNVWPIAALFLIVLGATARPALALLTAITLTALVFYINHIKWIELAQPLLLTDLFLVSQVVGHMDLMASYFNGPLLAALFIAWLVSCRLFWTTEPPLFRRGGRVVTLAIGLGLSIMLASPVALSWYEKQDGPQRPWLPIKDIESQGWLAASVRAAHTDLVKLPDPDPQALAALRSSFSTDWDINAFTTTDFPDLIVVLSESFFEPRHMRRAEPCLLLPDWCALVEQGQWGEMRVPTFGGNTTRTEYEVLTGVPYEILPQGTYPYNRVVLQPTASIAWWLKSLGYETTAIHPHDRHFWQRHRAMPLLGFDEFIGEQEFGPHTRSGFWISDRDLTKKVINRLEEPSEKPQFVFAISMENHGPWHGKRPNMSEEKRADLPSIEGLDDRGDHAYRNYLYHQRQAIEALDDLWAHVRTRQRPTAILFFGDHLPGLHETFRQVGFESDLDPLTHPVPYLLLQNEARTPPSWLPNASHQLGLWFMEASGLPLPSEYAILNARHQTGEAIETELYSALYPHLIRLDPGQWVIELCERGLLC